MYQPLTINLMKFLMAFSDTLDLVSPLLAQHQLRTAFIAWKLGEAARLDPAALETVMLAALLHDIGALTPEDKISVHEAEYLENIENHCILGEQVLRQMPLFEPAAAIVRYHHTPWEVWGMRSQTALAGQAQIVYLADTVERAIARDIYILHQDQGIIERMAEMVGTDFCPDLIELFRSLAAREEFWLDLVSPKLAELFQMAPCGQRLLPYSAFLPISEMMRNVIDFRSHFTAAHSAGVSAAAALLAGLNGYSAADVELMKMVGNLHDIGKMAVPNAILEKPDKLSRDEFAIIRQHTYHTYAFMQRCGFDPHLAEWAGFHHERLDGSGYPFHVDASRISIGSRIVAVADVLIAVAENRPYRKGMDKRDVICVLQTLATRGKLDHGMVELLCAHYDEVVGPTLATQQAVCEHYESTFLEKTGRVK